MLLTESEARRITDKALSLSKADSAIVTLGGHERGHIRFALNSVTTCGYQDNLSLTIESNIGQRSGSVSINELDDASIAAAVKRSEEIARLAPENAEFQPPLGPQQYAAGRGFAEATARARPDKLAALCKPALAEAISKKVTAAGFLESGAGCSALATSNGLFVFDKSTSTLFTMSARTSDGTGSGWAGASSHDIARLDTETLGKAAVRKALESRQPFALPPGRYTVILEASAVADLLGMMIGHFDARSADEGRSFLTKKGGGNKLGERLVSEKVNLYSDPQNGTAPGAIYSTDGLPSARRNWIENGRVKELIYSRFWARKSDRQPVPYPTNLVMTGGGTSLDEMIKSTPKGVLVTRFWYIRMVDPRTLVYTGLTRDGTFLIEDGRITRPIKNFRFNESPIAMLNNVEAMGPVQRPAGSEIDDWPVAVPPLLVRDFTFSSLSDAV